MLKKVLSLVLVVVMILSLEACGGKKHVCTVCNEYKTCTVYKVKFINGTQPHESIHNVCKKCEKEWKEDIRPYAKIVDIVNE